MKKVVAFIPIWVTYLIGRIISKIAYNKYGGKYETPYQLHNKFMIWSTDLEDWADSEFVWENNEKKKFITKQYLEKLYEKQLTKTALHDNQFNRGKLQILKDLINKSK